MLFEGLNGTQRKTPVHIWRLLFVAALALSMLLGAFHYGPIANASAPGIPSGATQLFLDDFNGASGTGVNTGNWLFDTGHSYPGGAWDWGTGEIESVTNSTSNVYQDGSGHLAIKPIRDASGNWTSGRIETQSTSFAPPAGGVMHVEASIQLPNVTGAGAQGYWPAFWMLGAPFRGNYNNWPSIGEIDIMESVNGTNTEYGTMHCGVSPGGPCNENSGISGNKSGISPAMQGNFHKYAVEYDKSVSPEQIRYYVDGINYSTINSNQVDATTWANATNHGYFIILNFAIGGGWPGNPTSSTVSDAPMLVDYVQVWTKPGGTVSGGITSGATYKLINQNSGKALDVYNANTNDGTNVEIWSDNGGNAQQWQPISNGNGTYKLINPHSGKALDVYGASTNDGSNVDIWSDNGTSAQQWQLNGNSDGTYTLINPNSGKALDVAWAGTADGTNVQIASTNGSSAQKWQFVQVSSVIVSGATYKLINVNSGKALDVYGASTNDGSNVDIWGDNGTAAQKWQVIANSDGSYKLVNPNSGKDLDVAWAGTSDGTNVQIAGDNGSTAQKWQMNHNGDGSYTLINVNSGKALDVSGSGTSDGTNVQIWTSNGSGAQKWQLIRL